MKKNWIQGIVAAACAVALQGVWAQAPAFSNGVVKIGVLTDMNGMYADLGGRASVSTAQMAIDDFIAAHKPDFKIELVSADHQNKAQISDDIDAEIFSESLKEGRNRRID